MKKKQLVGKQNPRKNWSKSNLVLLLLPRVMRIAVVTHEVRRQENVLAGSSRGPRSVFHSSTSPAGALLIWLCSGLGRWWWKTVSLEHVWGSEDWQELSSEVQIRETNHQCSGLQTDDKRLSPYLFCSCDLHTLRAQRNFLWSVFRGPVSRWPTDDLQGSDLVPTQPSILGNQSLTSRQQNRNWREKERKKPLISSRNPGGERRCIPILEATRREDLNGPRKKCAILSREENSYCLTLK